MKLIDKLWNWGHLEGSHNAITCLQCSMSPEGFAEKYGVRRSFIVSYSGNIQPPFQGLAARFSPLAEVKWSVLGDSSTPLPAHRLGFAPEIIACAKQYPNITGGIVDDFFSPERKKRFPPEVLREIRTELNGAGLDFWCVLYDHELDQQDLPAYLDCFDGVTFWLWGCEKIGRLDDLLAKFYALIGNKPNMLGVYLWDYKDVGKQPMDPVLFDAQLTKYFGMLRDKKTGGVVFCSNTVGDADLPTNRLLAQRIEEYGGIEIE